MNAKFKNFLRGVGVFFAGVFTAFIGAVVSNNRKRAAADRTRSANNSAGEPGIETATAEIQRGIREETERTSDAINRIEQAAQRTSGTIAEIRKKKKSVH
jgi:chemotaxis regulatin CheY-phosphate phosphatase CheZ